MFWCPGSLLPDVCRFSQRICLSHMIMLTMSSILLESSCKCEVQAVTGKKKTTNTKLRKDCCFMVCACVCEEALLDEEDYVEVHRKKEREAHSKCPGKQSFQLSVQCDSKMESHRYARLYIVRICIYISSLLTC